ncbi:unnamed protein product [Callosobruchus maculatus]|uniref:Coiled-coil domain-containing protein 134 n=1 Tax=Callosobruchus maculatus TaxID=64391 RepID=A0A653DK13_CALMS|nr:unnamed protein product [Callosobruchus maculatus]
MIIHGFFILALVCSISLALQDDISSESKKAEQLYIKLFKRQRAEQLDAIKNFQKVSNGKHERKSMLQLMSEKIFQVIQKSRASIESSPFIPGISEFPLDRDIQDLLSNILENTALFSEIVLRFPDIAASLLKSNNEWNITLQWSIAFCNQMKYLLDSSTIKLLSLASQELNYIPRDPDFLNPYRKDKKPQVTLGDLKSVKKKKKKIVKKGPRLSTHVEL